MLRLWRSSAGATRVPASVGSRRPEGLHRGSSLRNPAGREDPPRTSRREGLSSELDPEGRTGIGPSVLLRPFPGPVLSTRNFAAPTPTGVARGAQDGIRVDPRGRAAYGRAVDSRSGRDLPRPSEAGGGGVHPSSYRRPRSPPRVLAHSEGATSGGRMGEDATIRARRVEVLVSTLGENLKCRKPPRTGAQRRLGSWVSALSGTAAIGEIPSCSAPDEAPSPDGLVTCFGGRGFAGGCASNSASDTAGTYGTSNDAGLSSAGWMLPT